MVHKFDVNNADILDSQDRMKFLNPDKIFDRLRLNKEMVLADLGCGTGYFSVPASLRVKKVYALDIHPLAIKSVQDIISKNKLTNVETILSDCKTGLPDNSIDIVLLYDTFHMLSEPEGVLDELHRVLKRDGILSFSDHHMREKEILYSVPETGLFRLSRKGRRTYTFVKEGR